MANRTDAQRRADSSYQKRAYDITAVKLPKGALEQIKALADAEGVSIAQYFREAVEQRSGLHLTLDGEFKTKKKAD